MNCHFEQRSMPDLKCDRTCINNVGVTDPERRCGQLSINLYKCIKYLSAWFLTDFVIGAWLKNPCLQYVTHCRKWDNFPQGGTASLNSRQ